MGKDRLDAAIEWLEDELKRMQAEPRGELKDMDPDTALEWGYKMSIADLKAIKRKGVV